MSRITHIPFTSDRWAFQGSDKDEKVVKDDHRLVIKSGPKTDWWRTGAGSEPESSVNRTSGPLYYLKIPSDITHWKAGVWISGSFKERFQQATLFLGVGDYSNKGAWVKAGVEVEDGRHNVGCVVASPFSDWSISPSKDKIGNEAGESKLYLQYTRTGGDIIVHYAIESTATDKPPVELQLMREIKGFCVEKQQQAWHLGVMVCGPLSQQTEAQWEYFSLDIEHQ